MSLMNWRTFLAVGSLALFTEISLKLEKIPKKKVTCFAYFSSLEKSGDFVLKVKYLKPSAIEIMDSFSLDVLRKRFSIPDGSEAAVLVEFDSNLVQNKKKIKKRYELY